VSRTVTLLVTVPDVPDKWTDEMLRHDIEAHIEHIIPGVPVAVAEQVGWQNPRNVIPIHSEYEHTHDAAELHAHCIPVYREMSRVASHGE
jgi:hypothetical protein